MRFLLAGGTGYLGGHLVQEMTRRGLEFRAIARRPEKLEAAGLDDTHIVTAQATEPESIRGCCQGVDVVLSAVGITRQKDGLTYMDVDYQANRNLLDEALRAGVRKLESLLEKLALGGDRPSIIVADSHDRELLDRLTGDQYCALHRLTSLPLCRLPDARH